VSARRIFVGDVQGCLTELDDLLTTLDFSPGVDQLHPVGDLVNRGPDSLGVLRRAKELDAGGVLGNHDLHLLRRARGECGPKRRDTLDEVLTAPDREELLSWLAARPVVRDLGDLLLVHAGISPAWEDPVAALAANDSGEALDFAVGVRYCDESGRRPEEDWPPPLAPYRPWYEFWQERVGETRTAVFGHWARGGLVVQKRVRGLDTGCVWGKQLTAWIAEEDRIVQVPARECYSPTSLPEDGEPGS
jgi:bis(5'-nucleosyl)-tetraphosphatase (symmetrical)